MKRTQRRFERKKFDVGGREKGIERIIVIDKPIRTFITNRDLIGHPIAIRKMIQHP